MPPCAVYTTVSRQGIDVTAASYAKRLAQIARVLSSDVRPDVIAFQEVSGTQAVREALGAASGDYNVCSFDGAYKVQRLAFAWRKTLGSAAQACADVPALSLPQLAPQQQVRPGYTVTLDIRGKKVRFLTVHLKSSCVSSLEGDRLDGNTGADDPCPVLQQQVRPLEEAWEQLPVGADHFIVLGDFNRNLWHEANKVAGSEPVRSDGETDLSKPRAASVVTRNLVLEVNDGVPASTRAELLSATCPGTAEVVAACEASKTAKLTSAQRSVLVASTGLGCRNPVGLDHVLVSQSLAASVKSTRKVPVGPLGASLAAKPPQYPDPLLAISDHCPVVAEIEF
ncbi:Endonuclease/exonuclease/phosphatase family protein [Paracidovorax anthurii]|uniref:Endonuclease/exonuclease/phosphatase family protein n=2 Tax=Paracidovorax anthurii TaxID=78229 RepID=A0A328Z7B9_9BURK|nr:endonuclease/exonuclease/phosphatase family protein [Paracidovorax anthurii]